MCGSLREFMKLTGITKDSRSLADFVGKCKKEIMVNYYDHHIMA